MRFPPLDSRTSVPASRRRCAAPRARVSRLLHRTDTAAARALHRRAKRDL